MFKRFNLTIVYLLFIGISVIFAQKSLESKQPEKLFDEAMTHFDNRRYGIARILFEECAQNALENQITIKSDATFYAALSAANLQNDDAAFLLEKYVNDYPQSNYLSLAYFRLGELSHEEEKYRNAIKWYEKVNDQNLDYEDYIRFNFKSGYAHFMEGDYNKALSLLAKARKEQSQWLSSANYYYAYILYEQGKLDEALRIFEGLLNEKGYNEIAPYYIAQIYYMQGNYNKAIEYGTPLMNSATGTMRVDMARILGNARYAKAEYDKAIPLLEIAVKESKSPKRGDFFHLGLSYYFTGNYDEAANKLAQVTTGDDVMSQNAYYHLGDCYLKLNDKRRARVAFEAATRSNFDASIREDAMLNYIKLNYELSFSPFNEIINSFLQFIEEYPQSAHIDEAYEYLGQALLTTKNYRQALEAMERIKNKNTDIYKAMQRVSYYRGLELFTNLQFSEAVGMFDYSLKYGEYDRDIKMKSLYWRGETYYRLSDYQKAAADYSAFVQSQDAQKIEQYPIAHYNLGYIYFSAKNYSESSVWFNKYVNLMRGKENAMVGDALNRLGDTYYMRRDFNNAISFYEKGAQIRTGSPDYATFQKAFTTGILGNHKEKIRQLETLITQYPNSNYIDDSYYEIGLSYMALNNLDEAIRNLKTVKERFPQSSYGKKSMLQLGLVYFNNGDLEQSMSFYKRVVNEFPASPEAETALLGIRNIYLDNNDPDGYIRYTNQIGGFAKIDDMERDSISFVAAERVYMAGNCEQATGQLDRYISNNPQGRFVLNANYYKADCLYRKGEFDEALTSFEYVAGRGKSMFSEDALKRAGEIHFRKGNFQTALDYFKRLETEADLEENRQEALIGQMRALTHTDNPALVVETGNRVIQNSKMSPEIVREARYLKAKSLMTLNRVELALDEFKILSANTAGKEGAEAKYMVTEILFRQGKANDAEKEIFDFIEKGTPHQFWLAKGFILLSDIYAARGEYFQANQYLESLLENYQEQDDGIHDAARERIERNSRDNG